MNQYFSILSSNPPLIALWPFVHIYTILVYYRLNNMEWQKTRFLPCPTLTYHSTAPVKPLLIAAMKLNCAGGWRSRRSRSVLQQSDRVAVAIGVKFLLDSGIKSGEVTRHHWLKMHLAERTENMDNVEFLSTFSLGRRDNRTDVLPMMDSIAWPIGLRIYSIWISFPLQSRSSLF